jgi:catechol 2,3-dioxygenase-like lactoylglutathione lyase family enzyme
LMESGCKLEGFDRPAQPAVSNRLRCRAIGSVWTIYSVKLDVQERWVYAWRSMLARRRRIVDSSGLMDFVRELNNNHAGTLSFDALCLGLRFCYGRESHRFESYLNEKAHQSPSWYDTVVSAKRIQAIVGHVGIEVSSLSTSKKFYKALLEGLGFKIMMDTADGLGFSNESFSVWVGELREPRVKRKAPTGEEFVVADHLAIFVQDKKTVDAVERKMKNSGFKALFPCEEHPEFEPGYYAVSFCDPDNYVIEVYNRRQPK